MAALADARDLLEAARLIRRMGGRPGLVARLEARAGADLIGPPEPEAEPIATASSPPDPDYALLAEACPEGEVTMYGLLPIIGRIGLGARRWPNLTEQQAIFAIGRWLAASPWPRRKVHNRLTYSPK